MEENQFKILLSGPKISQLEPFFSPLGYQIECAQTGQTTLDILDRATIHTIIFELNLFDVAIPNFLEKIRQKNPNTSILLMEDISATTQIISTMSMGINSFVATPPNEEHLFREVKILCENSYLRTKFLNKENATQHLSINELSAEVTMSKVIYSESEEISAHNHMIQSKDFEVMESEEISAHNHMIQSKDFEAIESEESLMDSFEEVNNIKTPLSNDKGLILNPVVLQGIEENPLGDDEKTVYKPENILSASLSSFDPSVAEKDIGSLSRNNTAVNHMLSPQKAPEIVSLEDIQEQIDNPFSEEASQEEGTEIVAPIPSLSQSFEYEDVLELDENDFIEIDAMTAPNTLNLESYEILEEENDCDDFEEATIIANADNYELFKNLNSINAPMNTAAMSETATSIKTVAPSLLLNAKNDEDSEEFDIDFEA